jgi:hypothetical protein
MLPYLIAELRCGRKEKKGKTNLRESKKLSKATDRERER